MFLYICGPCQLIGMSAQNGKFYTKAYKGQLAQCPRCLQQTANFQRAYKIKAGGISGVQDEDEAEKSAGRAKRKGRGESKRFTADYEVPKKLKYDPGEDPGATLDLEFIVQKEFNPRMRLTPPEWGDESCRTDTQLANQWWPNLDQTSWIHRITAAKGRPAVTGVVMAQKLAPTKRGLSAYVWAGRGQPWHPEKRKSLEWCHLVADSLGGDTSADNLVAASYAANTFMLTIESRLQSKSALQVEVTARCSKDNCAELILYKIIRQDGKEQTWRIDARNDNFSEDDWDKYSIEVDDFLK